MQICSINSIIRIYKTIKDHPFSALPTPHHSCQLDSSSKIYPNTDFSATNVYRPLEQEVFVMKDHFAVDILHEDPECLQTPQQFDMINVFKCCHLLVSSMARFNYKISITITVPEKLLFEITI